MPNELEDVFSNNSPYNSLTSQEKPLQGLGALDLKTPEEIRAKMPLSPSKRRRVSQHNTKDGAIQELQEKNSALQAENKILDTCNFKLQEDICKLQEDLTKAKEELLSWGGFCEDLEEKKLVLEEQVKGLSKEWLQLQKQLEAAVADRDSAEKQLESCSRAVFALEEKKAQHAALEKQLDESKQSLLQAWTELDHQRANEFRLEEKALQLRHLDAKYRKTEKKFLETDQALQESQIETLGLRREVEELKASLTAASQSSSLKHMLLNKEYSILQNNLAVLKESQLSGGAIQQEINKHIAIFAHTLHTGTKDSKDIKVTDFDKELKYITAERNKFFRLYYKESEKLSRAEDTIRVSTSLTEEVQHVLDDAQHGRAQVPQSWTEILSNLQFSMQKMDKLLESKESSMAQPKDTTLSHRCQKLILSLKAIQEQCSSITKQYQSLLKSETYSDLIKVNCKKDNVRQSGLDDYCALSNIANQLSALGETLDISTCNLHNCLDILRSNLSTQAFKLSDQTSELIKLKLDYLILSQAVERQLTQKDNSMVQIKERAEFILDYLPYLSFKFAEAALSRLKIDFVNVKVNQCAEDALVALCDQKISLLEKKLAVPVKSDAFKSAPYIMTPWKTYSQGCEGFAYEAFDVFENQCKEFSWDQFKLLVSGNVESGGTQYADLNLYQHATQHSEKLATNSSVSEDTELNVQKTIASLVQLIIPYAEQHNGITVTIDGHKEYVQMLVHRLYAHKALWQASCDFDFNITIKAPQYTHDPKPVDDKMLQTMQQNIFGQHAFFGAPNIKASNPHPTVALPTILAY